MIVQLPPEKRTANVGGAAEYFRPPRQEFSDETLKFTRGLFLPSPCRLPNALPSRLLGFLLGQRPAQHLADR